MGLVVVRILGCRSFGCIEKKILDTISFSPHLGKKGLNVQDFPFHQHCWIMCLALTKSRNQLCICHTAVV